MGLMSARRGLITHLQSVQTCQKRGRCHWTVTVRKTPGAVGPACQIIVHSSTQDILQAVDVNKSHNKKDDVNR